MAFRVFMRVLSWIAAVQVMACTPGRSSAGRTVETAALTWLVTGDSTAASERAHRAWPRRIVLLNVTAPDSISVEQLRDAFPTLDSTTAAAAVTTLRVVQGVPAPGPALPTEVVLVSPRAMRDSTSTVPSWWSRVLTHWFGGTAGMHMSAPAFSSDRQTAVIYVGAHWGVLEGEGYRVLLQRRANDWVVIGARLRWIS